MKQTTPLTLAILLSTGFYFSANAQNAGINTTGAVPSANAVLDLNTGNKYNMGLIIPHVTLGASLATFSPPMAVGASVKDTGMMVYNMNGAQAVGYYCWNGTAWVAVGGASPVTGANNGATMNGTHVQLGGANPLLANTSILSGGNNLAFTGGGALQLGTASTSTGTLQFYNAGSANAVGISPGVTTTAYNLTLPLAQGAAGQVLTDNGAGALSWITPAASGAANGISINGTNVQLGGANPLIANTTINSGGYDLAYTGTGAFVLGSASASTGTLRFLNGTNANLIGITAGATTASYNLVLPLAQGAAGTMLTNNGGGGLSWTTPTSTANNGLTVVGGNVQLGGANPLTANTTILSNGNTLSFVGGGALQLGAASTSTGTLQFLNASNANMIGITVGGTTASYNLTLPLAQGAAGQVLTNNGVGALSWTTPAIASGAANGLTMNGTNAQLGGANPLLANTSIISGGNNLAFTGTGAFQLGSASSSTGTLQFYNNTNANAVGISPGATTAAYNLTLPLAQGAAGQVLTDNGVGALSWTTPAASGAANGLTMNGTNVQLGGANALLANTNIVSGGFNLAFTGTGKFQLGAASTSTGTLQFYNNTNANAVGISSGVTTTAYNLTLPLAQGAAGEVLTDNGAGALSWTTPAASGAANGLTMNGTNVQLGGANPLIANTSIVSAGYDLAYTGTGAFVLGSAAASTGTLRFLNATNANLVGITAGATTTSYNLVLPLAQGAAGTMLTNNGGGGLSWTTPTTSANNGITVVGGNVQLGGANPLTANTTILSNGNILSFVGGGAFQLGAASASTGTLQFFNASNANMIGITVGGTTASYNLTLPLAQGAAGQVLTNNGAGTLTWGTPAASGAANGLTMNGTNVQLGGANALTANTNIISGGFNLNLTGTGSLGVGTAAPASTVDVNGSFGTGTTNIAPAASSTTALGAGYSTIIATPSAIATTYTLTLPSATANTRRIYTIVYAGSGLGTIDVTSPVAGVIKENGATIATLGVSEGSVTIQSDGTNWDVLNTTTSNTYGSFVGIKYITATTGAVAFDAGTNSILVKVIGGGGAGSGGSTAIACGETDVAGTGGGAGGYVEGFLNNLTGSSTYAVTIGAGGTGSAVCGSAGGNGLATVLTVANPAATYTGNGGTGGQSNETNGADAYKVGGAGGTASSTAAAGTYITIQGATGGAGLSSNAGTHVMCSGPGAGTTFGPGGSSVTGRQVAEPGISAVAFGAGGGGGIIAQQSTSEAGGNGNQGLVIIYEYQ